MRALVVRGDLERAPGPGGRLLEDQRDVPTGQRVRLGAGVLGPLQVPGQVQQELQLGPGEVQLLEEVAVVQVDRHGAALPVRRRTG